MSAPAGLSEYSIALKAGTLLVDQYTIVGVLGRPGGFGITYLAEDIRLDTLVAIKEFLPRELATRAPDRSTIITHSGDHDSTFHRGLEQFLREARTLAKIHHPSVVRVRQFFEANSTAYLVMDYLEGQTLGDLAREVGGRLPAPRAVEIIMRVLDGLRAAHALNIYHRDVKPANIYITASGSPVLLDFGAARQATGTSGASMTAVLTPGFAPLEQYGHRGQGPWTDIYATSAVLYHILTGVDPVPATDRAGDESDPMVPPADIDPRLGQALSDAVMKGLSMAPRGRPQTATEFQELLREALAEHQGATTVPPILPVLPETIHAAPIAPPRVASFENVQPPDSGKGASRFAPQAAPKSQPVENDETPVLVSFKVPRRLLGMPLRIALTLTIGVATVAIAFVAIKQQGGTAATSTTVAAAPAADSVSPPIAAPLPVAPSADSALLARRADSAKRADSIALAANRRAVAESIRIANRARPDTSGRRPLVQSVNTAVQSGRASGRGARDTAKPVQQAPVASSPPVTSPYPTPTNPSPPNVPPSTGPAPTFSVAAGREIQRLADLFTAGDRRAAARPFTSDEIERIWRRLDGHSQISATAKVVDVDLKDSTATFFLILDDRATKASLFSGEYKASFNPFTGGLKLWMVTPTRRY